MQNIFLNFKFLVMLFASLLFSACVQPTPQEQEDDGIDFFNPPPWNRWAQIDENTRIPVGIHSSDAFDWAPDDRPIYFHTIEDIEQNRAQWESFFSSNYHRYPNYDKFALSLQIQAASPYDRHFADMPEDWLRGRGIFVGFGEPLADEYLHMFECNSEAPYIRQYRVKDYIIQCGSAQNIMAFVIKDPSASPPPPLSDDDPGRGAPEYLPTRWLHWFLDVREKQRIAFEDQPMDYSKAQQLDLFAYASNAAKGIETKRVVDARLNQTDSGYYWRILATRLLEAHCTDDSINTANCLSNNK